MGSPFVAVQLAVQDSSVIDLPWKQIQTVISRDPGRRGVAAMSAVAAPAVSPLQMAAESLANDARAVAIVTGFAIPSADRASAETDGPPGALYLAKTLFELGAEACLITDEFGLPLLHVGCDEFGLPRACVHCFPFESADLSSPARASNEPAFNRVSDAWVDDFLTSGPGKSLTHLIAIERVGPSHTLDSLAAQRRDGTAPIDSFDNEVPVEARNVCHNMRGQPINAYTAKTHLLFEEVERRRLPIATIGIGDGGNEIGMGALLWEGLKDAIPTGPAGRIVCRIATDHLLTAGVSNWGGYALATLSAVLRRRADVVAPLDAEAVRRLIERLVSETGAIDGVTRARQATVDGLPLDEYLQTLREIRRLCHVAD